jgi:hypothetical protein
MTTRYTFGVEFEVVLPNHTASHVDAARRLSTITGLPVTIASRTGRVDASSQAWRIVHDGSIRGGIGAELVSPVLRGDDGLAQVKKIADALQVIGATANSTCGFHVHVGGLRAADLSFFRNLVKLYAKFEPVIDTLMPVSRRGNANTYCRSVDAQAVANRGIDAATSFESLVFAATGLPATDYSARFFKLNLVAFRKHRTVEFRQHAGTVDSAKAIAWIKTCLRMVEAAANGKTGEGAAPAPESFATLPTKARKVAEYVTRPEGATRREILEGTDWAALSVNRQARVAGIQVREVRVRGESRFYAEATVASPVDLDSFVSLIGATPEESAFLAQRRAQINGA